MRFAKISYEDTLRINVVVFTRDRKNAILCDVSTSLETTYVQVHMVSDILTLEYINATQGRKKHVLQKLRKQD